METHPGFYREGFIIFGRKIMTETDRKLIYDLDFSELVADMKELGQPLYRAKQIWSGLYKELWSATDDFSTIPTELRGVLAERYDFSHLTAQKSIESTDGETQKTAFKISENLAIETVLMRYRDRRTLCISSQAGCAMGCIFCATGQMGFRQNLTSGEIVEQVIQFARILAKTDERLTNIVIMGMGEPFHNYESTMAAIERMNDAQGLDIGARRFTISTVGLVPQILRFAKEKKQVNLAISLHAADDKLRSSLLPVNRKYPLDELMSACREYVDITKRRITFEWALIEGVNDGIDQATKLALLLKPFRQTGAAMCHVNVIPLNPTRKFEGKATSRQQAYFFQSILENHGIPCTVRIRRGIDIQAGCGQLATG